MQPRRFTSTSNVAESEQMRECVRGEGGTAHPIGAYEEPVPDRRRREGGWRSRVGAGETTRCLQRIGAAGSLAGASLGRPAPHSLAHNKVKAVEPPKRPFPAHKRRGDYSAVPLPQASPDAFDRLHFPASHDTAEKHARSNAASVHHESLEQPQGSDGRSGRRRNCRCGPWTAPIGTVGGQLSRKNTHFVVLRKFAGLEDLQSYGTQRRRRFLIRELRGVLNSHQVNAHQCSPDL